MAVVVIVVLALVLHPSPSTSGAAVVYGTPIPFSQAIGPAASTQGTMAGGPWTIVAVEGVGIGLSEMTRNASEGLAISGCSTVWQNATAALAPATPSDAAAGRVSFWEMVAENASGDILLSLVSSPQGVVEATNLAIVTGSCASSLTMYGAIPSKPVDSSTAVESSNAVGGSAFLAGNTVRTVLLALLNPYWLVLYSTCSLYASGGTGTLWAGGVYASNGTAAPGAGTSSVNC